MWSSRTTATLPKGRGGRRGVAAICMALFLLSGCGFEPLYGRDESGRDGVSDELAQVHIVPLRDRTGQQMHNFLRDQINPKGQPGTPKYDLLVSLQVTTTDLGIRRDATATRANLIVVVEYLLRESGSGESLLRGRSRSTNSYNILESEVEYATSVSQNDAERRALRQISEEIRSRLAVYFHNRSGV